LREKLIKIGAKVVRHRRYVHSNWPRSRVPRQMSAGILSLIAGLRAPPARHECKTGADSTDDDGRGAP
jgi:hypothetical protein